MTIIVHEWDSDARCKRCLIPKALDPKPQLCPGKPPAARAAARMRWPLDGATAQALEAALSLTERERDEARRERDEALSRVAAEAGKDLAAWAADLDAAEAAHARVVAERDEARAEVERLRREREALVESEQRLFARVYAELEDARAEVDRARADVERSQRDGHPSDSTR